MVCSVLFKDYIDVAVHINYCNRPETLAEEAFVKEWCMHLGIPLYIRRIVEIKRKPCMENDMRDLYESYTRDVRYNTYKTVGSILSDVKQPPCVLLGHNRDDCIENVFTNISSTSHYANLTGMKLSSIQDDIMFVRPLLSAKKEDIYGFASKNVIPHLNPSTPPWSMRGQIRSAVIPSLNSWDKRFVPGLMCLSELVKDLHQFLETSVKTCIENTYAINPGVYELKACFPRNSIQFWKVYFIHLLNEFITVKSLKHMLTKLSDWDGARHMTVVIKKNIVIQFHDDKYCLILHKSGK
jgi:tRNA(Ile)-lysidine synthase TilS/MesJ